MTLNPQKQPNLSRSKFSSISKLVAYEAFLKQKQQRKIIEEQRKTIEMDVANLYRQAKRASKQLIETQKQLVTKMKQKSQKQYHQRVKSQYRKQKQQQLNELKNQNSLSKYMNMLKRQQAKRRLIQQNQLLNKETRQKEKSDQKMKRSKVQQHTIMLGQKNIAQSNKLKLGIELSQIKNLFDKKAQSSIVRNKLLELQNQRIQKEKQTIKELRIKKNDLSRILSKVTEENADYLNLLKKARTKSFLQMYDLAVENDLKKEGKRKRKSKRKRLNYSQSNIKHVVDFSSHNMELLQ